MNLSFVKKFDWMEFIMNLCRLLIVIGCLYLIFVYNVDLDSFLIGFGKLFRERILWGCLVLLYVDDYKVYCLFGEYLVVVYEFFSVYSEMYLFEEFVFRVVLFLV